MIARGMQAYSANFASGTLLTVNLSPKRITIAKVTKDSSSAIALSMNCGAPNGMATAPTMLITVSMMTTGGRGIIEDDDDGGGTVTMTTTIHIFFNQILIKSFFVKRRTSLKGPPCNHCNGGGNSLASPHVEMMVTNSKINALLVSYYHNDFSKTPSPFSASLVITIHLCKKLRILKRKKLGQK
jgi:hypothetical protein